MQWLLFLPLLQIYFCRTKGQAFKPKNTVPTEQKLIDGYQKCLVKVQLTKKHLTK